MAIAIDVNNRLDLPMCNECQMAEIEVDHETVYTFGGFVRAVAITVECEHRAACKRAAFMAEQAREVD